MRKWCGLLEGRLSFPKLLSEYSKSLPFVCMISSELHVSSRGGATHSRPGLSPTLFDRFGPLYLVDLRKGFAFLEYEHPEDATRARDEMHGYEPERGRVVPRHAFWEG